MNDPGRTRGPWYWLQRALALPRQDLGRAMLLFACMFLVITSYTLGKVARDALFLSRFDARSLPWADLSVALVIGAVVSVYLRLSRRLFVRDLLAASMVFFAANCAALWAVAHYYRPAWIYPVFYVWVGIFGVLAPAQVWTLANYVLNSREARRAFGLVGGGAIAGWISAGLLTTVFVQRLGTENLILVMVLLLAACGALVLLTWSEAGSIPGDLEREGSTYAPRNLRESARAVFSSPYLRAIATVVFLSSFATTVIGWQFKAIARQFFESKDALAFFFGEFNLVTGLLSLAIQMFLSGRLLKRFGIGPVLFFLPFALLAGSAGVILSASLVAVVLLRGADQVLRYSLDKPSVELLYVPVVARLKVQVKSFIDAVVWRAGDGLAAVALLLVVGYFGLPARTLAWVVALMAVAWGIAAWRACVLYMVTLKHSVDKHFVQPPRSSTAALGGLASDLLLNKLRTGSDDEVLSTLSLMRPRPASLPAVRELLSHPHPAICAKALSFLADAGDRSVVAQARALLSHGHPHVREEAVRYLCRHSHIDPLTMEDWDGFTDSSLRSGIVVFLAHPGPAQNLDAARHILTAMAADPEPQHRSEAAQLLGHLPDLFDPILQRLLDDQDGSVVRAAIRAVGALRKRRMIAALLDRIADPSCRAVVVDALVCFGDSIVGTLGDHLGDPSVSREARTAVASALDRIGTQPSVDILQAHIFEPEVTVRYAIINALAALRRSNVGLVVDSAHLESLLVAEVYGNYRSFQVLDVFRCARIHDATLYSLLNQGIEREQERIFRLLSTLYPHSGFRAAYDGLQSGNPTLHDTALEFLDNLLQPGLRQLIIPLIDPVISPPERARMATRLLTVEIGSVEDAVAVLQHSGDRTLRMCAAWATGLLDLRERSPRVEDYFVEP